MSRAMMRSTAYCLHHANRRRHQSWVRRWLHAVDWTAFVRGPGAWR